MKKAESHSKSTLVNRRLYIIVLNERKGRAITFFFLLPTLAKFLVDGDYLECKIFFSGVRVK